MNDNKEKRIVVVGGGFAGVFAAKHLHSQLKHSFQIELISPQNHFVFQPLLPEVAAGIINIQDAVSPLRALLPGVKVRMAEVCDIDFDSRSIHLLQGRKRVPLTTDYDQLVLACGLVSDFSRFKGFTEHTLGMKHLADAYELRNRVILSLENADATTSAELKRSLLTFVVIGGGFSGVETVGELTEMLRRTLRFYPRISASELRIMLIQRDARILVELSPELSDYASKKLMARGIEIRCNTGVNQASAGGISLDNGEFIAASTVVTTIGNGPVKMIRNLDVPKERGRIVVDRQLRVRDRPNAWAIGDAALIPLHEYSEAPRYAPPTAQFAVREARCLATNMQAVSNNQIPKPFIYSPRGSLASIGNYRAVAEIFGYKISGFPAWVLWRGFYLAMLPGLVTRLRVALNWLLDYFVPRSIVQLDQLKASSCRYLHFHKGSTVFKPNEIVDGLYTVVEGELESRVKDPDSGEDYVRIIKAGDHWGEMVISKGLTTVGQLTALTDTRVLFLGRDEFMRLREGFGVLRNYFDNLGEENYPPQLRSSAADAGKNAAAATAVVDATDSSQPQKPAKPKSAGQKQKKAPAAAKKAAPAKSVKTKAAGQKKRKAPTPAKKSEKSKPGSVETAADKTSK